MRKSLTILACRTPAAASACVRSVHYTQQVCRENDGLDAVDGKDGDFQTSPIDPSASCGGLGIGDRDTHDILFPYFIVHSVLSVQVPYLPSGNYAGLDAADATYWLARLQVDSAPVVLGTLPPQRKDPGDCTRAELAAIIKNTL